MTRRHPLESQLNADAWDILSAVQSGFRALVDVKGKLAEYFLEKHLAELKQANVIKDYEWKDVDGEPDFLITHARGMLTLECKNIRSKETYKKPSPAWKVELQRTRNSMDGTPTRGYRCNEFDILAVCLFNQTSQWEYLYAATRDLERRPGQPEFLRIMQRVPLKAEGPWKSSLRSLLATP